jgi:predicted esterase
MAWQIIASLTLSIASVACSQRPSSAPPTPTASPAAPVSAVTTSSHAAPASAASLAPAAPASVPAWPPAPPGVRSDFCIEGVDALDESACYVLPDAPTDELVIYLHGIMPPTKSSRQKTNLETVLKAASRRAGVAALLPRGRTGLAPRGHDGWWGWPTSRASYQAFAGEMVAQISRQRSALEALTGRVFARVYLAGSSSGAYFVTALLLQRALPADGYALISGAADQPGADLSALPRKPIYIGFGTHDTVGGAARALGARLAGAGFPVKVAAHPLPHGTAEIYLDEAFAHFRAARSP